jgi:hypothetical protein
MTDTIITIAACRMSLAFLEEQRKGDKGKDQKRGE